jgi:hypothetical protein
MTNIICTTIAEHALAEKYFGRDSKYANGERDRERNLTMEEMLEKLEFLENEARQIGPCWEMIFTYIYI